MKIFVIRQLGKENVPVVTGVVETKLSDHEDYKSAEGYLDSRADEIIRKFSEKFPEFAKANWYKQLVDGCSEFTELT